MFKVGDKVVLNMENLDELSKEILLKHIKEEDTYEVLDIINGGTRLVIKNIRGEFIQPFSSFFKLKKEKNEI